MNSLSLWIYEKLLRKRVTRPIDFWLGVIFFLGMTILGVLIGVDIFISGPLAYIFGWLSILIRTRRFGVELPYEEWDNWGWKDITGIGKKQ